MDQRRAGNSQQQPDHRQLYRCCRRPFGPLGNGSHGVLVDSEGNVIIGGTESDAANTIAYNGGDGIFAYRASNCVARRNSIFDNLELGIDIYGDGVTANRPANAVAFYYGANYPELTSAYTGGGSTTVAGTITTPHMPVNGERMKRAIDFYATPSVDEQQAKGNLPGIIRGGAPGPNAHQPVCRDPASRSPARIRPHGQRQHWR